MLVYNFIIRWLFLIKNVALQNIYKIHDILKYFLYTSKIYINKLKIKAYSLSYAPLIEIVIKEYEREAWKGYAFFSAGVKKHIFNLISYIFVCILIFYIEIGKCLNKYFRIIVRWKELLHNRMIEVADSKKHYEWVCPLLLD